MVSNVCRAAIASSVIAVTAIACQTYDFAYQPLQDRQGRHLRFEVQTPSRADLLFVVDNSGSMAEEQAALTRSISALIDEFAGTDTSYRVGIVSTDGVGFTVDCNGATIPPESATNPDNHGARGNCLRDDVILRRPHDGALGRTIAAYDPTVFVMTNAIFANLTADQKTAVAKLLPTGIDTTAGGASSNGTQGVPWVIDRDVIRQDACAAAGCTTCDKTDSCYINVANPVASAMVRAFFLSNIAGLGIQGIGWEEDIRTSLLAVGIDARAPAGSELLDGFNLTAVGRPNAIEGLDANFQPRAESWIRDDAALGIMYVSDEQDCSMPLILWQNRSNYEEDAVPVSQPLGSMCYQHDAQLNMLSVPSMANLVVEKKGSKGRVVVGAVAGLEKAGPDTNPSLEATPTDCADTNTSLPNTNCSCLNGAEAAWCQYTTITAAGGTQCDALLASRQVQFADTFTRKTFESICRADQPAYGDTLRTFADLAKLACFALDNVVPAGNSDAEKAANIAVNRALAGSGADPTPLPMVDPNSTDDGWYYKGDENQVCLVGRERVIGDIYDIFVTTVDTIDFRR